LSAQTDSVGTAAVAAGVWNIANVTTCVAIGADPAVGVTVAPYDPAAVGVPLLDTSRASPTNRAERLPALTANVGAGPAAVVYVKHTVEWLIRPIRSGGRAVDFCNRSADPAFVPSRPASRQVAGARNSVRGKPR
jgi:hypothetical protein